MRVESSGCVSCGRPGDHVAQPRRDEERVLGIADEADRRAVAGIENDAVVDRDAAQRLGEQRVEAVLELALLDDGLARILDDVDEQNAADQGSVLEFRHDGSDHRAPATAASVRERASDRFAMPRSYQ